VALTRTLRTAKRLQGLVAIARERIEIRAPIINIYAFRPLQFVHDEIKSADQFAVNDVSKMGQKNPDDGT